MPVGVPEWGGEGENFLGGSARKNEVAESEKKTPKK